MQNKFSRSFVSVWQGWSEFGTCRGSLPPCGGVSAGGIGYILAERESQADIRLIFSVFCQSECSIKRLLVGAAVATASKKWRWRKEDGDNQDETTRVTLHHYLYPHIDSSRRRRLRTVRFRRDTLKLPLGKTLGTFYSCLCFNAFLPTFSHT